MRCCSRVRAAAGRGVPLRAMAQAVKTRGPISGTAVPRKRKKFFLLDLYSTAVGKKYVMAITGIMLVGFVVFHMVGNLKMYMGRDDINHYAHFLQELLYPLAPKQVVLWLMRAGLIAAVILHIHSAYSLTVMNRKARAVKYQGPRDYQVANFASRTMRWSGIIIFLFIVWHLLDLTFGTVNAVGTDGEFIRNDVYGNIIRSFDRPVVSAFYILANLALGFHLFHGVWSLFQSMGWNSPRFNAWRRWLAIAVAAIVVVGNVSFPIAVLAGVVD